jgi:nicotinate-nucleotide pyrophosphorylase (carboxylating)
MDLSAFAAAALSEDLGPGDLTTEATIPLEASGHGEVLAKQDLVVCGHEVARAVLEEAARRYDGAVEYRILEPDGARVAAGTVIATVAGSLRAIVVGERVALNLLMRLCGIATHVGRFVDAAGEGGPRVVDTRKTTPLLRDLEKYAVRCGGAHNHRRGLYDGVMVKDNHITAVGDLTEAVRRVRAEVHHLVRIEVEARTLAEVEAAARTDAEVLLLDNMDDDMLARAIEIAREIRPTVILEASGNITPQRVAGMAARGLDIDVVSAGGLIHQAVWSDLSLKLR